METLTGQVMANLVPSSMNAGSTTCDDRKWTMSAPGSPSVLPVEDKMDVLPHPQLGAQIPVGTPGMQRHTPAAHPDRAGGTWSQAGRSGSGWKETP